jgi:hypothetical protein
MNDNSNWTRAHTWGAAAIVVAIFVIGLLVPGGKLRLLAWLLILGLMFGFVALVSHGVTGMGRGWLIDERKKISLSRLQIGLWTVVVLSAYFTAALANLHLPGQTDPLRVEIPIELWVLMGISTTALVATPLVRSNKLTKSPQPQELAQTKALLERQGVQTTAMATVDGAQRETQRVYNRGLIMFNAEPEQAQWSDLFKGEETGNAGLLDMGKIQMFFFTLIVVLAYAMALGSIFFSSTGRIAAFPPLDPSMDALLGISTTGYLANKAMPHSQTA